VDEFSSKGLLPQLTDVLEALADSQQRLLVKIQDVRLQQARASTEIARDIPASAQQLGGAADLLTTTTPLVTTTAPQSDAALARGVHEREVAPTPSPRDTLTAKTDAGWNADVGLEPRELLEQPTMEPAEYRTVEPSDSSAVQDEQTELAPHETWEPAGGSTLTPLVDEVGTESANRNYNFFDELDDRLAALDDDPGSRSAED
jgi:hypothetical protein